MNIKYLIALFCIFITLDSCYSDKADQLYPQPVTACDTTNVTYAAAIQPIIMQSCAKSGCHDATASGGYNFLTYAGVIVPIQNGRLLGSINHAGGYIEMPQNAPKLDDCSINEITSWINKGYPNN